MHLTFTFKTEILQCWQKFVPIPNFSDHNLAIVNIYHPNVKGVEVKTMQKWCFMIVSQLEFGCEWQP